MNVQALGPTLAQRGRRVHSRCIQRTKTDRLWSQPNKTEGRRNRGITPSTHDPVQPGHFCVPAASDSGRLAQRHYVGTSGTRRSADRGIRLASRLTMSKQSLPFRALGTLILIWVATTVHAGQAHAPATIALGGYDLVSYRSKSGPVLGSSTITAVYGSRIYQFVSEQHRAAFLADPKKYLPRYDGWCATNLSMGRLSVPDYTNFEIEDGSLLLFEHNGFTNGRTLWNTDPSGFRARADQHASELLK